MKAQFEERHGQAAGARAQSLLSHRVFLSPLWLLSEYFDNKLLESLKCLPAEIHKLKVRDILQEEGPT